MTAQPSEASPFAKSQNIRNRSIARAFLAGLGHQKIATKFGIDRNTVGRVLQDPAIQAYLLELEAPIEAKLVELERLAVSVKEKILSRALDEDAGLDDLELANNAATDMLNRRGERGAPTTKAELKQLSVTGVDLQVLLGKLARDPGTRKILDANPKVKALLAPPRVVQDEVPAPAASDQPAES